MQKTTIILAFFIFLLITLTTAVSAQNLQNFTYMRKITITERSGQNLTDYPVMIILNDTNFNFTHAQTNGADIRFTDANGNLLSYWIESWDSVNKQAKVWVKVPSIPANGTVEIFMYYGNPEAPSKSNGKKTFEKFYSFEDVHNIGWTMVTDLNNGAVKIGNKVLIGYHSPDLAESGVLIYDVQTKTVTRKKIVDNPASQDHYTIVILETQNYILAFVPHCPANIARLYVYRYDYDLNLVDTVQLTDYNSAFPQVVKLNNGRIYVFYRDDSDPYHPVWKYRYSDDEGATWSAETQLTTAPAYGSLNYIHVATDGERVYVVYTEWGGTERRAWGIWFMYLDTDGQWKKDDGTVITLPASPDDMSRPPLKDYANPWQILYYNGKVYIYYHDETDSANYKYYRAIWDGNSWTEEHICDSNHDGISSNQLHYGLGICAKQDNPNIVYVSVDVNGVAEIQKWEFIGGSWTKTEDITKNSVKYNWRPIAVRGGSDDFDVVWQVIVGYYNDWNDMSGIYLGARGIYPNSVIDWKVVYDAWSISEEHAFEGKYCIKIDPSKSEYQNISAPFTFGFFFYDAMNVNERVVGGAFADNGKTLLGAGGLKTDFSTEYYWYRHDNVEEVSSVPRSEGWHKVEVKVSSPTQLAIYIDDVEQWEGSVNNSVDSIAVGNWWPDAGYTGWADCIYVRKFASVEPLISIGKEGFTTGVIISDVQLSRNCIGSNTLKIEWFSQKYNLSDLTFYIDLNGDGIWDKVLTGCNITDIMFDRPDKYKITIKAEYPNGSYTFEKTIQIVSYHPLLNCTNIVNKSGIVTWADKAGVPTHVTITPVNISKEDFIVVVSYENINASKTGDILLNMTIAGLSGGDEIIVEELAPNAINVDIYHNGQFYKTVPVEDGKVKVKLTTFSEYVFVVNNTIPAPPKEEEKEIEEILIFVGIAIGLVAVVAGAIYLAKRTKAKTLARMESEFKFFRRLK